MSKYDLEKPKRYRVIAKHGINSVKSNSIILVRSNSFLSEWKKELEEFQKVLKNG